MITSPKPETDNSSSAAPTVSAGRQSKTCAEGRFRGGCPTCDDPTGSQSYREYNAAYGSQEYQAWEAWFKAHKLPAYQIPLVGWVARDVERRTVSVKVFHWNPDDESAATDATGTFASGPFAVTVYQDRDDDGHWASQGARYGVHTVQLDSVPLPFPDAG